MYEIKTVLMQVKETINKKPCKFPEDVINVFKDIENLDREGVFVLTLNAQHQIIDKYLVGLGVLSGCLISPREIFKPAIMDSAASIFLVHNHPSGNPNPSEEDNKITERIKKAGKILGIELLDHIIIGSEGFYSFLNCDAL